MKNLEEWLGIGFSGKNWVYRDDVYGNIGLISWIGGMCKVKKYEAILSVWKPMFYFNTMNIDWGSMSDFRGCMYLIYPMELGMELIRIDRDWKFKFVWKFDFFSCFYSIFRIVGFWIKICCMTQYSILIALIFSGNSHARLTRTSPDDALDRCYSIISICSHVLPNHCTTFWLARAVHESSLQVPFIEIVCFHNLCVNLNLSSKKKKKVRPWDYGCRIWDFRNMKTFFSLIDSEIHSFS